MGFCTVLTAFLQKTMGHQNPAVKKKNALFLYLFGKKSQHNWQFSGCPSYTSPGAWMISHSWVAMRYAYGLCGRISGLCLSHS